MDEIKKFRDTMKRYKEGSKEFHGIIYHYDENGRKRRYGTTQLKILNDLRFKGYKIYNSTAKEIGANFMSAYRSLRRYGYMIRYFKFGNIKAVFYVNKAKETVQELYKMFPDLAKRPGHRRDIEVPIMRNLNKLGSITALMNRNRQGKLNDTERNSYGNKELVKRGYYKRRKNKNKNGSK